MKAIFLKEWRQAHLLPWTGLLLSALIMVLYALWATRYATTPQDVDELVGYCVLLMWIAIGVILLASASGLIAAETSTGTVTYLLGLPISRSRMWWGKVFAGLGLTAVTAVLLIVPASLVLPGIREQGHFLLYLPDMVAGMLCVFAVAMFCSTIFARPLTVFIVAPLITLGLAFVPACLIHDHRVLLGYDEGMADLSLWALLLAPPFFLASWLAFTRGELLDSRRRWWYAFPVLAGWLPVVVVGMLFATDQEARYRRSAVVSVSQVTLSPGSNYAAVVVHGSRAAFSRSVEEGWRRGGKTRSTTTVLVDLETGRDVMWWPSEMEVAPSTDGRLVATFPCFRRDGTLGELRVQQVAWGDMVFGFTTLYVTEEGGWTGENRAGTWSGDGKWLACVSWQDLQLAGRPARDRRRQQKLLVLRADGGVQREVLLSEQEQIFATGQDRQPQTKLISPEFISSWQWVPGEEALYLLNESGELSRYSAAHAARTVLWRRPGTFARQQDSTRREIYLGISQDGTRIAVRAPEVVPEEQHAARHHTWVLAVEPGRLRQLAEFTDAETRHVPLVWAGDNRTLYLGIDRRWEEGQAGPTRVRESESKTWRSTAVLLPFGSGMLFSIDGSVDNAYFVDASDRFHLLREAYPKLNGGTIVAIDARGWVVITAGTEVAALDPNTGAVSRLYP
jgi:hypothetical protein